MLEKVGKEEYYNKAIVLSISSYFFTYILFTHLQEQKKTIKKEHQKNPKLQNLAIIVPGNSLAKMLSLWNMTVFGAWNIQQILSNPYPYRRNSPVLPSTSYLHDSSQAGRQSVPLEDQKSGSQISWQHKDSHCYLFKTLYVPPLYLHKTHPVGALTATLLTTFRKYIFASFFQGKLLPFRGHRVWPCLGWPFFGDRTERGTWRGASVLWAALFLGSRQFCRGEEMLPPQMAIYKQQRMLFVGPAHTASNWMF